RRRHTRFSRDWSSDVCSSDLTAAADHRDPPDGGRARELEDGLARRRPRPGRRERQAGKVRVGQEPPQTFPEAERAKLPGESGPLVLRRAAPGDVEQLLGVDAVLEIGPRADAQGRRFRQVADDALAQKLSYDTDRL